MDDAVQEEQVWYANTGGLAAKAAVVAALWESTIGVSLTVEVRSAVDKLRRSSPHPGSDPNPGTKPNGVHHAEAMPAGPEEGSYVTVWFSEELTQEEREAVARAFEIVKARLSP